MKPTMHLRFVYKSDGNGIRHVLQQWYEPTPSEIREGSYNIRTYGGEWLDVPTGQESDFNGPRQYE